MNRMKQTEQHTAKQKAQETHMDSKAHTLSSTEIP